MTKLYRLLAAIIILAGFSVATDATPVAAAVCYSEFIDYVGGLPYGGRGRCDGLLNGQAFRVIVGCANGSYIGGPWTYPPPGSQNSDWFTIGMGYPDCYRRHFGQAVNVTTVVGP